LILTLSSTLLYNIEHDSQPDVFSSIPAAAWAAISTLTPVGSGAVNPVTPAGKLVAALSALIGIGIFAIPAGILARAFLNDEFASTACPHCGTESNRTEP